MKMKMKMKMEKKMKMKIGKGLTELLIKEKERKFKSHICFELIHENRYNGRKNI